MFCCPEADERSCSQWQPLQPPLPPPPPTFPKCIKVTPNRSSRTNFSPELRRLFFASRCLYLQHVQHFSPSCWSFPPSEPRFTVGSRCRRTTGRRSLWREDTRSAERRWQRRRAARWVAMDTATSKLMNGRFVRLFCLFPAPG